MIASNDLLGLLPGLLENELKLKRVDSAAKLQQFIVDSKLPAASDFTPRFVAVDHIHDQLALNFEDLIEVCVHGVIVDPRSATICLIHVCSSKNPEYDGENENDGKEKAERKERRLAVGAVKEQIRQAVALRHVLLASTDPLALSYSVELTIFVPDDSAHRAVSKALYDYMLETSYLHSIGVSLLAKSEGKRKEENSKEGFRDNAAALRRAFPWLMTAVRKWYTSDAFRKNYQSGCVNHRRLKSLELDNFRLAGKRKWHVASELPASPGPPNRLLLIHGHNGSGKSTITESVELMVTGQLERLELTRSPGDAYEDGVGRYVRVLRSRYTPEKDALITAHFEQNEDSFRAKIVGSGIGQPARQSEDDNDERSGTTSFALNGKLNAGAFRMDQRVADDLVRMSESRKAGRFLQAFFPTTRAAVDEAESLRNRLEQVWRDIPESVRGILIGPEVTELEESHAKELSETIPTNIAAEGERAELLRQLLAEMPSSPFDLMRNAGDLGVVELPSASEPLSAWDAVWKDLTRQAPRMLDVTEELIPFVQQLNDINFSSSRVSGSQDEYHDIFCEWSNSLARRDLLQKEIDILGVIAHASAADVKFLKRPAEDPEKIGPKLQRLRKSLARTQKQLETMQVQIQSFSFESDTGETDPEKPLMIPGEIGESLSTFVSLGSEGRSDGATLVAALTDAIRKGEPLDVRYRDDMLRLGVQNGASRLVEGLQARKSLAHSVVEVAKGLNMSLVRLSGQLGDLRAAAKRSHKSSAQVIQTFREQLQGELGEAVNELTALFTPARWAYEDVKSDIQERDGRVTHTAGDVDIDLRLNTAELNAFALVLFLLCAPQSANPLRMLMLDDPFQNMDELTVTTIARGLNRLLAVWKDVNIEFKSEGMDESEPVAKSESLGDWQMTILLHGEENLERLRRECACQAFFLPWLTPSAIRSSDNGSQDWKQIERDVPKIIEGNFGALPSIDWQLVRSHEDVETS